MDVWRKKHFLPVCYVSLVIFLAIKDAFGGKDVGVAWSYSNISAWGTHFAACDKQHQSPVDIVDNEAVKLNEPMEIHLDNNYNTVVDLVLKNNGKTVIVSPESPGINFTVTGQGIYMQSNFSLQQVHFHWGNSQNSGSEHSVNGKQSAMEVHLVHYNLKYQDFKKAKEKLDGILVLSVLVESSKQASFNSVWKDIGDKLVFINKLGTHTKLKNLRLQQFLPKNVQDFYTYRGSFTTPPCSQTVTWVIFKEKLLIPEEYRQNFMDLHSGDHNETDIAYISTNVRPVQPLNSRTVLKTFNSTVTETAQYYSTENVIDKRKVISILKFYQCHLPLSVSLSVIIPSQDVSWKSGNITSDLKHEPLDVTVSYSVKLEMHHHPLGLYKETAHVTATLSNEANNKRVEIIQDYFKLDETCLLDSCRWSKEGVSRTCSRRVIGTDEMLIFTLSQQDTCNHSHSLVVTRQNFVIFDTTIRPKKRVPIRPKRVDRALNGTLRNWYFVLLLDENSASNTQLFLENPYTTLSQRSLVLEGKYKASPKCGHTGVISHRVKLIVGIAVGLFILTMVLLTLYLLWRRYNSISNHKPNLLAQNVEDTNV